MSDEDVLAEPLAALAAAEKGRRESALAHLLAYARTGATPKGGDPEAEAIFRAACRRLSQLPRGHQIPEAVATAEEFLDVIRANRDSPQKSVHVGWSYSFGRRRVQINFRASVLLNYDDEKHRKDVSRARCEWRVDDFALVPTTDHDGQKFDRRLLALASRRAYEQARKLADVFEPWGFSWFDEATIKESVERMEREAAEQKKN